MEVTLKRASVESDPLHCPTCALPISEDGEEYIGEGDVS